MNVPRSDRSTVAISPALLFLLTCIWIPVSLAGGRLAATLVSGALTDLVRCATVVAMLFSGFFGIARLGVHDLSTLSSVGFVRRPGISIELGKGLALGWAMGLFFILPAVLNRSLYLHLTLSGDALARLVLSLAVLVCFALLVQLILSGLPIRLLVRSIGPTWSVIVAISMVGIFSLFGVTGPGSSFLFLAIAVCLFVVGFLRTRAVWLSLGLQLGWTVSLQLLFGAVSPYTPATSGPIQSGFLGSAWFTGGLLGPETSAIALFILVLAFIVLIRMTRTYAWHYTYQSPVPAGMPMEVKPPPAHEQEQRATAAPLVQINGIQPSLPVTPSNTQDK